MAFPQRATFIVPVIVEPEPSSSEAGPSTPRAKNQSRKTGKVRTAGTAKTEASIPLSTTFYFDLTGRDLPASLRRERVIVLDSYAAGTSAVAVRMIESATRFGSL